MPKSTKSRRAKYVPIVAEPVCRAGGKPSTWFPPGGLVEQIHKNADQDAKPTTRANTQTFDRVKETDFMRANTLRKRETTFIQIAAAGTFRQIDATFRQIVEAANQSEHLFWISIVISTFKCVSKCAELQAVVIPLKMTHFTINHYAKATYI